MSFTAVKHHKPKPAADLLGISVSQLYVMIAAGEIVAHKIGASTVIADPEIGRVQAGLPRLISKAAGAKTPETPDPAPSPASARSA